ncbi:MAG: hypothetical protein V1926_03545 [Candidatus Peregrinibacteria bacterium]
MHTFLLSLSTLFFSVLPSAEAAVPPIPVLADVTLAAADPCAEDDLYGDGVCDEDCAKPDPDCAADEDPCETEGWYGDGTCDDDCLKPDPDCESEEALGTAGPEDGETDEAGVKDDECLTEGWYNDGVCDEDCLDPDPDCEGGGEGTDLCDLENLYGDGICDDDCLKPDPDCEDETGEALPGEEKTSQPGCPEDMPIRCADGSCADDPEFCPPPSSQAASVPAKVSEPVPCPLELPTRCSDGTCVLSLEKCPGASVKKKNPVETEKTLATFVKKLKESDEKIADVSTEDNAVTITYKKPAKLFGFIPLSYRMTVSVKDGQEVTADSPWWLILTKNDTETAFQNIVQSLSGKKDAISAEASPVTKKRLLLETMSEALKSAE